MSFDPNLPVDVYVCFGVERGTKFPHWMLMLRERDSIFGTWYHSTGGPSQSRPYEVTVQGHKRVDSHGIQSIELLGTIRATDVAKVTSAAKRIQPQQCQTYVVSLVAELENRRLLPPGHAAQLNQRVQMSAPARDYLQAHPVPPPSISHASSSATYIQHSAAGSSSHDIGPAPPIGGSHEMKSMKHGQRTSPQSPPIVQQQRPRQRGHRGNENCGCCIVM